jgi:hypothetical protein
MDNYLAKKLGQVSVKNSAYGKTNSSHPLQNMGYTLDQVKDLVDNAQKVIGINFTSIAGTTQPNIQIPATAKYMIGFAFAGAGATTDTFSLLINNERAIDNGSAQAYQIGTGRPDTAFYSFFRPVAGATSINLTYTSTAGGTAIVFQLIYI